MAIGTLVATLHERPPTATTKDNIASRTPPPTLQYSVQDVNLKGGILGYLIKP